ncbi:hypothetical protein AVEN_67651-1 [Araneus ventricosus]|uniref:SPIN-DOC-like zinc-finger domain-containing protein n=1 Tax=Araneus ventricosus TaxID=182803 RepID=A0A4Y2UG57_ARAVE|nr:hypothetical protein AVEN_67651-1 [Araneus ventricosus]
MASGRKKRRTEEENREFNQDWTESFAFIYNRDGLQSCLICHEKLVHNKKSNLERHFITKHTQFAGKYPTGEARKKAVEELPKKTATVKFHANFKHLKDGFAERFEQFKINKSSLAFIVNPLNINTNEINIEPFGIDAESHQMQMDLKTKDLWSGKFTEFKSKLEELEVQKCMHIAQHK